MTDITAFRSQPAVAAWKQASPDSTFTFWVQQSDGTGTIYIGSLEAPDLEAAKTAAVLEVCEEWNSTQLDGDPPAYTPDNIHLLGIAAGDVEILHWQDICEAQGARDAPTAHH